MSLPALFEITAQLRDLQILADSDDLPMEVIRDTLEGLKGDLTVKATNIAKFVLSLEADAEAIEAAAAAIKERAARRKRRADAIRAYLLFQLQGAGISKVECPEFTLSVRKNPEAVEIEDIERLPERFMVQPEPPPKRPDKAALKAALKAGESVPGAWLRQGEHLAIKI